MKNISKCKIGAGILFMCLLTMTQVLAAPKNQEESVPLGTWTQQGIDLNGDGVISGDENERVFFFNGAGIGTFETVTFTIRVEGGVAAQFITCVTSEVCRINLARYEPGFHRRLQAYSDGIFGVFCASGPEECKFTVTDVRP